MRSLLALTLLWLTPGWAAAPESSRAAATTASEPSYFAGSTEALAMLQQVVGNLEEMVRTKDLSSIHSEDMVLAASLVGLRQQGQRMDEERRAAFRTALADFAEQVAALHLAGDLQNQPVAEEKLRLVLATLGRIKAGFKPAEVAAAEAAASQFTCPTHRDIRGQRTDTCPKCGASLDQQVRILPEFCGLPLPTQQTMTATIHPGHPLVAGQRVPAFLDLVKLDGTAVYPSDLIVTHTERIHLLIIDPSLTDYHHEHPRATSAPGEYAFAFTPRLPGRYLVWADVRPRPLGLQEFVPASIGATITGEPGIDRTLSTRAVVEGMTFELSFSTENLRAGRPTTAKLRITGADGKPFTQLEPFMNAFVHLVGFHEDRQTVLHLHPKAPLVLDPAARGGPEFEFQMFPPKAGFVRLFAQVQVGGGSIYAPFGVRVAP
jgi:hypothetical protein